MSSNTDTDTAKPNNANANASLLSRIFRRASKLPDSDAESTTSKDPLVQRQPVKSTSQEEHNVDSSQPMKSTSREEHDSVSELMAKANTMGEDEFKAYLKEHKEEVEAMYRKQGGGIASGDWVSRDWATGESLVFLSLAYLWTRYFRNVGMKTSERANRAELTGLDVI
ncbi:hypothetical protein A1O7_09728 [Cladophialophora yegresii CBS 114405]|uniref:Uncharacterized protein n=1 Tax=Cladophialophora yegresii CBS 114405 TaxID=1182544 RepID=W9W763_9EURO|nr:uncharacterized protein A1O7_09728 [Cladophialophora yegresii CBS 114405]EXJ54389.1 hypothetical protein A1O7_09728 [Cladophialophora yegresii CBS 114405]